MLKISSLPQDVFVSWGLCNKFPPTRGLRKEKLSPPSSGAQVPSEMTVPAGPPPRRSGGGPSCLSGFRRLQVLLGLWPHHSTLGLHSHLASPLGVCVCVCLLFCLLPGHLSLGLNPTWIIQNDLTFPLLMDETRAKERNHQITNETGFVGVFPPLSF